MTCQLDLDDDALSAFKVGIKKPLPVVTSNQFALYGNGDTLEDILCADATRPPCETVLK